MEPDSPARSAVVWETAALVVMLAAGTALAALLWWPLGLVYVGVYVACNLLFMAWICPYCPHCEARTCHSGYHHIARFFRRKEGRGFEEQFRRNVAVMAPVWALPPLVGLYLLVARFTWIALTLLVVFCLFGFVVLPAASKGICARCANAAECPRGRGRR